ncbi:hypothetical protein LTR15_000345 [Elasticomyces elasticus]|nr:hypothetical protein LTR15_000345 [Elasticomyces elasticus]
MRNILPDIARVHPLSSKVLSIFQVNELVDAQIDSLNNIFRNDLYPYSQDSRNNRMDVTQDSNKNYFSRTIFHVYEDWGSEMFGTLCGHAANSTGEGVTKRCLARIEAHLTRNKANSPFTKVERSLMSALIKNNAKHMSADKESVMKRVGSIFSSLYQSFDRLIDKTVEDPKERQAREALQAVAKQLEEEFTVAREMLTSVKERYVV